jgi:hypothetical protein
MFVGKAQGGLDRLFPTACDEGGVMPVEKAHAVDDK